MERCTGGARYALYFSPEEGSALAEIGWRWLGRRPDRPDLLPLPPCGGDHGRQAEIVADARRYGFHATLKSPFHLVDGFSRADLCAAVRFFAAERRPFIEPPFALAELDGFLALRPLQPTAAIGALADDCVRHFDRFRASSDDQERRTRPAQSLSERQKHYLALWGYPYVFDEFRLHLTLTCRLSETERAAWRSRLQPLMQPALSEPVAFQSLCLFEQPAADAPFVLSDRFPFGSCGDRSHHGISAT